MKKFLSLLLILAILSCGCLMGCDDTSSDDNYNSNNNNSSNSKPPASNSITEAQAISIAKNSSTVHNAIAREHYLKFYSTPNWGTVSSGRFGSGWQVSLQGTISGYTDDYKSNYKSAKFTVTVNVDSDGFVTVQNVF